MLFGYAAARARLDRGEETLRSLEAKRDALLEETAALRERLPDPLTDEALERLARERLGLVRPGERIYIFSEDREVQLWEWKSEPS